MANRVSTSKVIPFHAEPDRQLAGMTAENGQPITDPGPELTADEIEWEPFQAIAFKAFKRRQERLIRGKE